MNLFGMMETSGSAMQAERMRAEVVAANMANAETTRTQSGGPYKRQHVIFSARPMENGFADSMTTAATAIGSNATVANGSGLLNTSLTSTAQNGSSAVGPGVQVAAVIEDAGQPLKRYDPGHPDAGADGYVSYPDINPLTEMVDLMGATRAYGLNSSAVQAEKGMIASALDIARS
jgi:flagellar basal-body rod protein FlgC